MSNLSPKKVVLVNSTQTYSHLGCYLTMSGLKSFLCSNNCSIVYELGVNQYDASSVNRIMDTDSSCLLVINGEGTFHDDQPYAKWLIGLSKPYAHRTVLINSQFKNMSPALLGVVRHYALVSVRTKRDMDYLKAHGFTKAVYCPDMLFNAGIINLKGIEGHRDDGFLFTDSHSFESTLELLNVYRSMTGRDCSWVDFHFLNLGGSDSKSKRRVANLLLRIDSSYCPDSLMVKSLNIAGRAYLSDLVNRFMSAECIVTGRYHAACLGIALGIPVVYSYSNTTKVEDVCTDFGWGMSLSDFKHNKCSLSGAMAVGGDAHSIFDRAINELSSAFGLLVSNGHL